MAGEKGDRLHGEGRKCPELGIRQIWNSVFAYNFSAGRSWTNDFPSLGQLCVYVCFIGELERG